MADMLGQLGLALGGVQRQRSSGYEQYLENARMTEMIRDAGFGHVVIGQHFLAAPLQYLHPVPALAALAARSGDMKLVVGIMLASMVNPVDAAEQLATLDVISKGRLVLGIGMGYRSEELAAFGVARNQRAARMIEALSVIRQLWTGDPIDHEGEHFVVRAAGASLVPHQENVDIWMAAMSPVTLKRSADMGVSPYIGPAATLEEVRTAITEYRSLTGNPEARVPLRRDIFVTPNQSDRWDAASAYVVDKYQVYADQGFDSRLASASDLHAALDERVIVGDVEHCAEQFRMLSDLGAGPIILRWQWPSLPPPAVEGMLADIQRAASMA